MQELRKQGVHVSQKKVDRIMSEEGLRSITVREQAIFEYMECFYNRKKSHSALGYVSPCEI
jgi:transposase InsO family protein